MEFHPLLALLACVVAFGAWAYDTHLNPPR